MILATGRRFDDFRRVVGDLSCFDAVVAENGAVVAVMRFQIAPRLTTHVRHRTKYLDMPVNDAQAFVFSGDGGPDFSRWIDDVFRDGTLAARIRRFETAVESEAVDDIVADIDQAIRAPYEPAPLVSPCRSRVAASTERNRRERRLEGSAGDEFNAFHDSDGRDRGEHRVCCPYRPPHRACPTR